MLYLVKDPHGMSLWAKIPLYCLQRSGSVGHPWSFSEEDKYWTGVFDDIWKKYI